MPNTRSSRRNFRWYRLDNAAIIVPSTTRGPDTRVFRLTCELREEVEEAILQEALDDVMEEFPHLRTTLRKGMFWYYFDETQEPCLVKKDTGPVCDTIYIPGKRSVLFRVLYLDRRISLEMFHAAADGTGGLMFLRKLVTRYLVLRHGLSIPETETEDSSNQEKSDDAFARYYTKGSSPKIHNYDGSSIRRTKAEADSHVIKAKNRSQLREMTGRRAYQIPMEKDLSMRCHCIEGTVSASAFKKLADASGTTVGIFAAALLIQCIIETMDAEEAAHPIVISVPVNLRQYFPSKTTRNFFGVINVSCDPCCYDGTIQSILPVVRASFEENLTADAVRRTMNSYSGLVHNLAVKAIPLFLKDIAISRFFFLAKRGTTATLSNLGRVRMPQETIPYIDRFSAFMATPNMQICISSFEDRMVFGAVTAYAENRLLPCFFRKLAKAGLDVEIGSNDCDAR